MFDEKKVWDRLEEVEILSTPVRTPGAVDTLHFLAYHGLSHLWGEQRLIRDFALYAKHRGDDRVWREAVDKAEERGFLVMFLAAVQLAVTHENLDIPDFVAGLLTGKKNVQAMANRYGRQLESGGGIPALKTLLSRRHVWDSRWDRFQWFFRLLFKPNVYDHAWIRLPPALGPVYYLHRPLRLMWRSAFSRLQVKRNAC